MYPCFLLKDFCPKNNRNVDDDSLKNEINFHRPVKRCRLPRPIQRFLQPKIAVTGDPHCSKVRYNCSLLQVFRSWGQRSLRPSSPFGDVKKRKRARGTRERETGERKKSLQRLLLLVAGAKRGGGGRKARKRGKASCELSKFIETQISRVCRMGKDTELGGLA